MRSRYLVYLAATVSISAILFGGFNLVVDPYGLFPLVSSARFNAVKPHPERSLNDIKMAVVRQRNPDALILGNSRSEIGFDPQSQVWRSRSLQAYNLAIPGTGIGQVALQLRQLEGRLHPKEIVLGVDFLDFLIDPQLSESRLIAAEELEPLRQLRMTFVTRFSIQALMDSLQTLRLQSNPNPQSMTSDGFNPLLEYLQFGKSEGYYAMFRQRAEENARRYARLPKALFLAGSGRSPDWDALNEVLAYAVRNGTQIRLVIYPYHAQLLALFEESGLWPLFEQWKQHLVQTVEQSDAGITGKATVWDFSGFSQYQCESIPPRGDKHTAMRWYWEGGHFKKELGDTVLARIQTASVLDSSVNEGLFGQRLTSTALGSNQIRVQSERANCLAENPGLFRDAALLAKAVRKLPS